MRREIEPTFWAKIYMSGPIEVAKQTIRAECLRDGLCVTIEPTTFIYTGGEECGYVVGLINYPRFPQSNAAVRERARDLMHKLMATTFQHSALLMTPDETEWVSVREETPLHSAKGADVTTASSPTRTAPLFRNRKNGELYCVLHRATDATNARDGTAVVVYRRADLGPDAPVYVRDEAEFEVKFEAIA